MHLTYNLIEANSSGEMRHAQMVMRELGIQYSHATPQSIADCWQFWNCINVPDTLPSYLKVRDRNPLNSVGHGLSASEAEDIQNIADLLKTVEKDDEIHALTIGARILDDYSIYSEVGYIAWHPGDDCLEIDGASVPIATLEAALWWVRRNRDQPQPKSDTTPTAG